MKQYSIQENVEIKRSHGYKKLYPSYISQLKKFLHLSLYIKDV